MTSRSVTLFARGLKFPEGPAFDKKGNLFTVNIDTGDISKITPDGRVETFVNTGGVPNGAKFHANGDLYVADRRKGIIAISPEGKIRTVVDTYKGRNFNGPNDLVFDSMGNLYFTDPWGSSAEEPFGNIYRLSAQGELKLFASKLAFPNGIVISRDGKDLWVAITRKNRILRYGIDEHGNILRSSIFCQLSGGWGPDGMALDVAGNLYVAHFGAGDVVIINPKGEILERVPIGGTRVTNVAFGGPDRKTLYVTEVDNNAVFRFNTDYPGLPLYGEMNVT